MLGVLHLQTLLMSQLKGVPQVTQPQSDRPQQPSAPLAVSEIEESSSQDQDEMQVDYQEVLSPIDASKPTQQPRFSQMPMSEDSMMIANFFEPPVPSPRVLAFVTAATIPVDSSLTFSSFPVQLRVLMHRSLPKRWNLNRLRNGVRSRPKPRRSRLVTRRPSLLQLRLLFSLR